MLWVGGHILLVSLDELGWHAPYDLVHHWEEAVHDAVGRRRARCWAGWSTPWPPPWSGWWSVRWWSAVMHVLPFGHGKGDSDEGDAAAH